MVVCMTTSRPTGVHRWSRIMRLLAPGPVAFGTNVFVDPAVWRAFAEIRRKGAQPQGTDERIARGAQR
jgi:hypothetical protein